MAARSDVIERRRVRRARRGAAVGQGAAPEPAKLHCHVSKNECGLAFRLGLPASKLCLEESADIALLRPRAAKAVVFDQITRRNPQVATIAFPSLSLTGVASNPAIRAQSRLHQSTQSQRVECLRNAESAENPVVRSGSRGMEAPKKTYHAPRAGPKAERRKEKKERREKGGSSQPAKGANPKVHR